MKRKFIFFTMLLLTLIGGVKFNVLNAQESENITIEIGNDATSSTYWVPFCDYYSYFISQQIYLKDEIGYAAGTINSVSFRVYSGNVSTRSLEVYMKNIDQNAFSGNYFIAISDSDKVFDGNVEVGTTGTWCTIEFTTPFNYTGNNVVVCVYDKTGSGLSTYHYFYSTSTSGKTLYSSNINVTPTSIANGSASGSIGYYRNQIKFGMEVIPAAPQAPVLTAKSVSATSIALSWNSVLGADSYNIYQGSSQIATNITETTFTVENLEMDAEYCFQVSAVNEIGESEKSDEVCTTIKLEFAVEIGADQNPNYSSNLYLPVYDFSKYAISQQIYTKDEIGQEECIINSVSFKVGSGYAATRQYEVYLKNTDQSTFNNSNYIAMSASDKVFDGSVYVGNAETWYTINFTTPFTYTGNNIVICVYDKTGVGAGNPGYHQFYKYSATGRSLYSQGSSAYNATSLTTGASRTYVNQIKFDAKYITPTVEITPESIDLGTVRTDANFFTEKAFDYSNYAVTVKAQGGAYIETNTINQEGDFFKIVEVSPIPTDGGYYYHISYNQNGTTGEKEGTLVVTYKDSESETETKTATIPLSAIAYSSATDGEAIENPIEVAFTNNAFTHAATGMHDDYILPGEEEENDGKLNDAVYKFTLENDAVLTASVNGTNPIVAIYNSDFGEKDGPSSDNNYEGVSNEPAAPSAPTTFFYDFEDSSLEDFNLIDADGDGNNWQCKDYYNNVAQHLLSYSWGSSALNPDNYIVTKEKYLITETSKLVYKTMTGEKDNYAILVSDDGENFVTVFEEVPASWNVWYDREVELGNYQGEKYIALRHYNCAGKYNIQIDNLQLIDGSAKSRSVAQTRSTNQIDRVLYPAGTYYLVAAAEGDFTLNLSTSELSAPAAATLTAPANDAKEQNNPLLTWTLDKFAEEYQLLLGTTNPLTDDDVVVDWSAPATSYQTEGLANNTVYYWQVKSKNSVGESSSEVFSFVTPLNKPTNVTASKTNLYPGDETTISWTEAAGATSYNVYVGEDKVAENVEGTSYQLSELAYNITGHNITVTANHTLGESAKSDAVVVKVAGTFPLTVNVKDSKGNPIGGATVTFNTSSALDEFQNTITAPEALTTNAEGVAEIILPLIYNDPNTFGEQIIVYANKTPFKENFTSITPSGLSNDVLKEVNINLSLPAPSNLYAEKDMLLAGQDLTLNWTDVEGVTGYNVYKTSGNGVYTFVGTVTENTYTAVAEYDVYGSKYAVSAVFEGGLESDKAVTYDYIYVLGTGDVKGLVKDTEGNTVAGAALELSGKNDFGEDIHIILETKADGTFLVEDVIEGTYSLTVSHYNYESATVSSISVEYNIDCDLEPIELTPKASIENVTVTADNNGNVSWIGDYAKWNVYRRNTNAPQKLTSVATELEAISTIDAAWETLEPGTYQYGVSALVEPQAQTRGTEVIFEEGFDDDVAEEWDYLNFTRTTNASYCYQGGSMRYFSYGNGTGTLTSPIINLGKSKCILSFYCKNNNTYYPQDDNKLPILNVNVLNEDSELIATIGTINYRINEFTLVEFELGGYDVENIIIQFEGKAQYGTQIVVDEILIVSTSSEVETQIVWSNEVEKKAPVMFYAYEDKDWNNPNNWNVKRVPTAEDEVVILTSVNISSEANANSLNIATSSTVTVDENGVLNVAAGITNNGSLVLNDGGQIFQNNANIYAKFNMGIENPTSWSDKTSKDGWQFISSPFNAAQISLFTGPFTPRSYDLYKYDGGKDYEWINHKSETEFEETFVNGRGYLASYETLTSVELAGYLYYAKSFTWDNLTHAEKDLANFHLLGNPFTFDMDIVNATFTNLVEGFAVVTPQGGYDYSQTTIPVGDGFFVKATGENPSLYYNHNASVSVARRGSESNNSLNITATGNAGKDNVVINFAGKSEGFDKLQNFNDAIATVYVAEDGKNYGIYNCDADVQEVELSFNANQMGNYTISIEPNGKFQTVTLVDRFTGIETNMLVEDYNFTAMSEESPNRFIVRMVNGQQTTDNSHFVYQSGEELILNIQGDVQIVDVLGRVVYNGEAMNDINRINVSSFNSGAYMVRVMNGNEVKVEKVVIY